MRLAAVGDLHCKKTSRGAFEALFAAVADAADVLVLCGDLTDYGLADEARVLVEELAAAKPGPIVAVLGNHDYESGQADPVKGILRDAGGEREGGGVGWAGVKGMGGGFGARALQPWGEEVLKRFVREAVEEALKLESALAKLTSSQRVAVLHYSPIRETVEGEPPEVFPFLGSSRLEEPLLRYPVAVALHGHAHHGRFEGRTRNDVPVYNVCIPVLERLSLGHPPYWMVELDPAGSPSAVGRRLRVV